MNNKIRFSITIRKENGRELTTNATALVVVVVVVQKPLAPEACHVSWKNSLI